MLSREDNELIYSSWARHADGQPDAPVLAAGDALVRAAGAGQRPGARQAAGRAADRLPRLPTARWACSRTTAPTAARACSSAATKRPACAASTTAGNSTVDGTCVDMPNEPAESDFKRKVKAVAYPTPRARRRGVGVHGSADRIRRRCPTSSRTCATDMDLSVYVSQQESNWLQVLEGDIDTVHAGFLHSGSITPEERQPGSHTQYMIMDRTARFEVVDARVRRAVGRLPRRTARHDVLATGVLPVPGLRHAGAGPARPQDRLHLPRADGRRAHPVVFHGRPGARHGWRQPRLWQPDPAEYQRLARSLPNRWPAPTTIF